MKLLEPRVWSAIDIVCLKWSSILFGAVVGAYFASFVLEYMWAFILALVILALRPVFAYFNPKNLGGSHPQTPAGVSQ